MLAALVLLWPSSTAGPEADPPPWLTAQMEFKAKLREVAEASQQVRLEIEASGKPPPVPVTQEDRPECQVVPVPHRGNDAIHDMCADEFPPNRFPGHDVLVNGKYFDALERNARRLWEIKTDRFDTYSPFLRERVLDAQVKELEIERDLAFACGYDFAVGVSHAAHQKALRARLHNIQIEVTGC